MTDIPRCQSCGLPLRPGHQGTQKDGSLTREYCSTCFKLGEYLEPALNLAEMVKRIAPQMEATYRLTPPQAVKTADEVLRRLKRWAPPG